MDNIFPSIPFRPESRDWILRLTNPILRYPCNNVRLKGYENEYSQDFLRSHLYRLIVATRRMFIAHRDSGVGDTEHAGRRPAYGS